jgi:hypothetical protein
MKAFETLRTQECLRTHEHMRAQYNFHKSLGAPSCFNKRVSEAVIMEKWNPLKNKNKLKTPKKIKMTIENQKS